MTRDDLVRQLNSMGADVSERTLRYWEQVGKLPKAQRGVYYDDDIVPRALVVAITSGRLKEGFTVYAKGVRVTVLRDGMYVTTTDRGE